MRHNNLETQDNSIKLGGSERWDERKITEKRKPSRDKLFKLREFTTTGGMNKYF